MRINEMPLWSVYFAGNWKLPGPRNWHPRARTAAHRLEESCCGFWCCKMSSVTVRSPRERAALIALTRPSSSTSWQWTKVTSFLCMGRLKMLWAVLLRPTPAKTKRRAVITDRVYIAAGMQYFDRSRHLWFSLKQSQIIWHELYVKQSSFRVHFVWQLYVHKIPYICNTLSPEVSVIISMRNKKTKRTWSKGKYYLSIIQNKRNNFLHFSSKTNFGAILREKRI